ncbi:WecB/TagA/CpsF family glycosyltransferase [Akkermansiaceae bacterium]|nr:WecB/TagA/CpsF family glycosyltransferase [Akkermansiaceae bacterium]
MLRELKLENSRHKFLEKVQQFIENSGCAGYCCAVNANIIVECFKDQNYFEIIRDAAFNTCDGINVKRIFNATNKIKINCYPGPDLFEDLVGKSEYQHYFLGGQKKVLEGLKNKLKNQNSKIRSANFFSPPFLSITEFDYKAIADLINQRKPDIIWIGLGAPKQERFMSNLLPHIHHGLMIGVGAAFNFFSGLNEYKRAPFLMRKYNLEWLYRLNQEPKRIIKRQLKCAFYLPQIYFKETLSK